MSDEEKEVAALLRFAGPRAKGPAADVAAITAAAREVWRARYVRRSSAWRWLAAAAAIVVASGVAIWWPHDSPIAARVEHVAGNFHATEIQAGETLATDASTRVALRMDGGQSVRVDRTTRLRLSSATVVELESGAVYVDTEGRGRVDVRTPGGDVHPMGTRFEVRVDGVRVGIRVRDGRVAVDGTQAVSGEEVLLDGGSVTRGRIRADDAAWNWALDAIAPPEIEGRTLHEFVTWLAYEKGWNLRFATADLEARSRTITLHGSVRGLTAEGALQTVMLSAGMQYTLQDGVLEVRRVSP